MPAVAITGTSDAVDTYLGLHLDVVISSKHFPQMNYVSANDLPREIRGTSSEFLQELSRQYILSVILNQAFNLPC